MDPSADVRASAPRLILKVSLWQDLDKDIMPLNLGHVVVLLVG